MVELKDHQRRRASCISLVPDIDGTGSGSLLDSILSAPLKTRSGDVWVALHSIQSSLPLLTVQ